MRWRLIDRILTYRRDEVIVGRVAVPFEGALLGEPLGRDGAWPESLLVGAASELALWAAAEASTWRRGAELAGIIGLEFRQPAVHAELLTLSLGRDGALTLHGDAGASAHGRLEFAEMELAPLLDPQVLAEDWEVLRGTAA